MRLGGEQKGELRRGNGVGEALRDSIPGDVSQEFSERRILLHDNVQGNQNQSSEQSQRAEPTGQEGCQIRPGDLPPPTIPPQRSRNPQQKGQKALLRLQLNKALSLIPSF